VTDAVIDEAIAAEANLIVTHHPMMIEPRRNLLENDREGWLISRMVCAGISLISAHTNLDLAPGGINDVLAERCGLTDITGEGYVRCGRLPEGETVDSLVERLGKNLQTTVRVMGQLPGDTVLEKLALSSGGGSGSWDAAEKLGAQVFLSGEIKHHHALELSARGILGLECGHHATEEPGIFALADALQKHGNAVQWKGCVSTSRAGAYPMR